MSDLYKHQREGVAFLCARSSAMLADEQGTGKTRQALTAAFELFCVNKIDRVLVLAPAAVRYAWREEIDKLESQGENGMHFLPCVYEPKSQKIYGAGGRKGNPCPILVLSYALLPQKRHVAALRKWCSDGKTLLVCDESSFLKNRTAKQTKASAAIAGECRYRWLLTGTPVANSPLDLYGQSLVMSNGSKGPLSSFKSFYQFQARYAVLKHMKMGPNIAFKQVVGYQNVDELNRRFTPYVLRREKKDCLDLPSKSYTIREVALTEATWRIYQELRREALLALPDEDVRPEPNAAVRIARLRQLTSGHVGTLENQLENWDVSRYSSKDISSEKLDWLVEQIISGELANEQALIVWCAWRRERERLQQMLAKHHPAIRTYGIFGGQQEKNRSQNVQDFMTPCLDLDRNKQVRRVLVAQQHAGGYGLTLTAASTCVYLSNTFSHVDRIQSEDRVHRVSQINPCLYIDILAIGPKGQKTVDHHVLECLRSKKDLAALTCSAWRRALE